MCDCRMELGSFPKVHLFPTSTKEHAQGMKALCNPCVERKGCGGRTRKPSGNMSICGRINRGVTRVSP